MKMKKKSFAAMLAAALLVVGITAAFATSQAPKEPPPQAAQTEPQAPNPQPEQTKPGQTRPEWTPESPAGAVSAPEPIPGAAEPAPTTDAPNSAYPVNSKGETYGIGEILVPSTNDPDLIAVPYIKDGENIPLGYACFVRREDIAPYRYPRAINTPEDAVAYMAWVEQQPYSVTLPAYDKEGNAFGTTEVVLNDSGNQRDLTGMDLESAREEVKNNRWNVPADPIPEGSRFVVTSDEDEAALRQYLRDERGVADDILYGLEEEDGTWYLMVARTAQSSGASPAEETGYPVNSKGETYGTRDDCARLGYDPDLIWASSPAASGYAVKKDLDAATYGNQLEGEAYQEWLKTQPVQVTIPLYDVNHDTVLGQIIYYHNEH